MAETLETGDSVEDEIVAGMPVTVKKKNAAAAAGELPRRAVGGGPRPTVGRRSLVAGKPERGPPSTPGTRRLGAGGPRAHAER